MVIQNREKTIWLGITEKLKKGTVSAGSQAQSKGLVFVLLLCNLILPCAGFSSLHVHRVVGTVSCFLVLSCCLTLCLTWERWPICKWMSTFKDKDFNTLIKNFGRGYFIWRIIQTKRKESAWVLYRANVRKRKVGRS